MITYHRDAPGYLHIAVGLMVCPGGAGHTERPVGF
jgi:hypothetical protein